MQPHAPAVQQQGPQMVNVNAVRGLLYRQRWLVAAVVFAAAVIGLTVTLLMTPMYEATSKVSIKPFGEQVVDDAPRCGERWSACDEPSVVNPGYADLP